MQTCDYFLVFGSFVILFWICFLAGCIPYPFRQSHCANPEECDSEEDSDYEEEDTRHCLIDMTPILCQKKDKYPRQKTKLQNFVRMTFKTKDDNDIELRNRQLLSALMHIPHFVEMCDNYSLKKTSEKRGLMEFWLKICVEELKKDETIKAVMDFLMNEKSVKHLCLDEMYPIKVNATPKVEPDPDIEIIKVRDSLRLTFETNAENIQNYQNELLQKIFAVAEFEENVHFCIVQHESGTKGTMQFILKESPLLVMANMAIYRALKLLRNEPNVSMLDIFVMDAG